MKGKNFIPVFSFYLLGLCVKNPMVTHQKFTVSKVLDKTLLVVIWFCWFTTEIAVNILGQGYEGKELYTCVFFLFAWSLCKKPMVTRQKFTVSKVLDKTLLVVIWFCWFTTEIAVNILGQGYEGKELYTCVFFLFAWSLCKKPHGNPSKIHGEQSAW